MAITIAVTNQKGGVGKTATTSALAYILSQEKHFRVLTIDMDPQRNLDMLAGKDIAIDTNDTKTPSILTVLSHECKMRDAIVPSELGDLCRASALLSNWIAKPILERDEFYQLRDTPDELVKLLDDRFASYHPENTLMEILPEVEDDYDFILIDTNPSLTLLTLNALMAADYVLSPIFLEAASKEALDELNNTIQSINYNNPGKKRLQHVGILPVKMAMHTNLHKTYLPLMEHIANQMQTIIFQNGIKQSVSVSECMSMHQNIMKYDPASSPAKCYEAFTDELLERIKFLEKEQNNG